MRLLVLTIALLQFGIWSDIAGTPAHVAKLLLATVPVGLLPDSKRASERVSE